MPSETDQQRAILFADVVGSTRLYSLLGDAKAREVIAVSLQVMVEATEACAGTVIKTIGDEVMATFLTPDDALSAATKMQERTNTHPLLQADEVRLSIRIGCHFGLVTFEERDIFGAAVHAANSVTSEAKGGQILATVAVIERLSADWQWAIRQIDVATLKGRTEETALYEVHWQTDDVTGMLPSIDVASAVSHSRQRLRLIQGEREWVIDEQCPMLSIGRGDQNEILVKGDLISRQHARIEMSKGRFSLTDLSTNGTFVKANGDPEQFVRRDSTALAGSGVIGLGESPEKDMPLVIRYSVTR
jgi:class 3 adenylate cyclase